MILEDRRIFIIEDNLENRSIAQMLLEAEGATIAFDRWGKDFINKMRKFAPIDIILLD